MALGLSRQAVVSECRLRAPFRLGCKANAQAKLRALSEKEASRQLQPVVRCWSSKCYSLFPRSPRQLLGLMRYTPEDLLALKVIFVRAEAFPLCFQYISDRLYCDCALLGAGVD